MANKSWFSAKLLFMAMVKGHEKDDPLCEESIIVLQAEDDSIAKTSASQTAIKMEHDYVNEDGEQVEWKFMGILEVQDLCEETLESGTEVFSHLFLRSQSQSSDVRDFLESHPQACETS
jgi:hypothetical protein